ncbi:uncharacterized protein LOC136034814 isoform X2 [Artemia franciscana]|uniref:uncharacterized protein LOC136034814 isoform X2 n=1 Tax=Artemia franciscana TaxID=6661 RepID=UPI0032DAA49C
MTASEISRAKTIFILATVIGCFAVLWPKVFYPMLQGGGTLEQHHKDDSICCGVVFEMDTYLQLVCTHVLHKDVRFSRGSVARQALQQCRENLLDTCKIDIRAPDYKPSQNLTTCLTNKYGVDDKKLHHRPNGSFHNPRHMKPERPPHLHPEVMHPGLKEKGRTILPSQQDIRNGRPPIGMRPPMGAGAHVGNNKKGIAVGGGGAMNILMPLYTIGIIVFFVYTVMKVLFKKPTEPEEPKIKDFGMDPEHRKFLYEGKIDEKTEMARTTSDEMQHIESTANLIGSADVSNDLQEAEPVATEQTVNNLPRTEPVTIEQVVNGLPDSESLTTKQVVNDLLEEDPLAAEYVLNDLPQNESVTTEQVVKDLLVVEAVTTKQVVRNLPETEWVMIEKAVNDLPEVEPVTTKPVLNNIPETDFVIAERAVNDPLENEPGTTEQAVNDLPEADPVTTKQVENNLQQTESVITEQTVNGPTEAQLVAPEQVANNLPGAEPIKIEHVEKESVQPTRDEEYYGEMKTNALNEDTIMCLSKSPSNREQEEVESNLPEIQEVQNVDKKVEMTSEDENVITVTETQADPDVPNKELGAIDNIPYSQNDGDDKDEEIITSTPEVVRDTEEITYMTNLKAKVENIERLETEKQENTYIGNEALDDTGDRLKEICVSKQEDSVMMNEKVLLSPSQDPIVGLPESMTIITTDLDDLEETEPFNSNRMEEENNEKTCSQIQIKNFENIDEQEQTTMLESYREPSSNENNNLVQSEDQELVEVHRGAKDLSPKYCSTDLEKSSELNEATSLLSTDKEHEIGEITLPKDQGNFEESMSQYLDDHGTDEEKVEETLSSKNSEKTMIDPMPAETKPQETESADQELICDDMQQPITEADLTSHLQKTEDVPLFEVSIPNEECKVLSEEESTALGLVNSEKRPSIEIKELIVSSALTKIDSQNETDPNINEPDQIEVEKSKLESFESSNRTEILGDNAKAKTFNDLEKRKDTDLTGPREAVVLDTTTTMESEDPVKESKSNVEENDSDFSSIKVEYSVNDLVIDNKLHEQATNDSMAVSTEVNAGDKEETKVFEGIHQDKHPEDNKTGYREEINHLASMTPEDTVADLEPNKELKAIRIDNGLSQPDKLKSNDDEKTRILDIRNKENQAKNIDIGYTEVKKDLAVVQTEDIVTILEGNKDLEALAADEGITESCHNNETDTVEMVDQENQSKDIKSSCRQDLKPCPSEIKDCEHRYDIGDDPRTDESEYPTDSNQFLEKYKTKSSKAESLKDAEQLSSSNDNYGEILGVISVEDSKAEQENDETASQLKVDMVDDMEMKNLTSTDRTVKPNIDGQQNTSESKFERGTEVSCKIESGTAGSLDTELTESSVMKKEPEDRKTTREPNENLLLEVNRVSSLEDLITKTPEAGEKPQNVMPAIESKEKDKDYDIKTTGNASSIMNEANLDGISQKEPNDRNGRETHDMTSFGTKDQINKTTDCTGLIDDDRLTEIEEMIECNVSTFLDAPVRTKSEAITVKPSFHEISSGKEPVEVDEVIEKAVAFAYVSDIKNNASGCVEDLLEQAISDDRKGNIDDMITNMEVMKDEQNEAFENVKKEMETLVKDAKDDEVQSTEYICSTSEVNKPLDDLILNESFPSEYEFLEKQVTNLVAPLYDVKTNVETNEDLGKTQTSSIYTEVSGNGIEEGDSAEVEEELRPESQGKYEEQEMDLLRKRLEETEAAMERIVAQMGSVSEKLLTKDQYEKDLSGTKKRLQQAEKELEKIIAANTLEAVSEILSNQEALDTTLQPELSTDVDPAQESLENISEMPFGSDAVATSETKISIVGMEVVAELQNGGKLHESLLPIKQLQAQTKSIPQGEISSVLLDALVPSDSQLLISEAECCAEALPIEQLDLDESEYEAAPVVLSGKMTISVTGMEILADPFSEPEQEMEKDDITEADDLTMPSEAVEGKEGSVELELGDETSLSYLDAETVPSYPERLTKVRFSDIPPQELIIESYEYNDNEPEEEESPECRNGNEDMGVNVKFKSAIIDTQFEGEHGSEKKDEEPSDEELKQALHDVKKELATKRGTPPRADSVDEIMRAADEARKYRRRAILSESLSADEPLESFNLSRSTQEQPTLRLDSKLYGTSEEIPKLVNDEKDKTSRIIRNKDNEENVKELDLTVINLRETESFIANDTKASEAEKHKFGYQIDSGESIQLEFSEAKSEKTEGAIDNMTPDITSFIDSKQEFTITKGDSQEKSPGSIQLESSETKTSQTKGFIEDTAFDIISSANTQDTDEKFLEEAPSENKMDSILLKSDNLLTDENVPTCTSIRRVKLPIVLELKPMQNNAPELVITPTDESAGFEDDGVDDDNNEQKVSVSTKFLTNLRQDSLKDQSNDKFKTASFGRSMEITELVIKGPKQVEEEPEVENDEIMTESGHEDHQQNTSISSQDIKPETKQVVVAARSKEEPEVQAEIENAMKEESLPESKGSSPDMEDYEVLKNDVLTNRLQGVAQEETLAAGETKPAEGGVRSSSSESSSYEMVSNEPKTESSPSPPSINEREESETEKMSIK